MTRTAPCDWPIVGSDDCDALTESGIPQEIKRAAVTYLWDWTGRQYGLCDLTIRPCRQDCPEGSGLYYGTSGHPGRAGALWTPVLIGGEWLNLTCGRCRDVCGCDNPSTLRIPGPVDTVTEITIDGEVLAASAYRVDNRGTLVRQDGGQWPTCQDLGKAAGEPGTWSVTYSRGVPVPEGGKLAASVLACELAKAIAAPKDCRLPQRIQTITREGVTVGFLDSFEGIESGQTGIWLIDSWVASVTKRPKRTRVLSPDTMPARVTTDGV